MSDGGSLGGPGITQAVPNVLKDLAFTRRVLRVMHERKIAYASRSSACRKRALPSGDSPSRFFPRCFQEQVQLSQRLNPAPSRTFVC